MERVQRTARTIAEFIGLGHLTFIVTFVGQKEGIGGHIELQDDSPDVYVEIAPEMRQFPEALLATLSHELTHKFLYTNRLYKSHLPSAELENEVLTDVAAVYLGLGKLMLNGCVVRQSNTQYRFDGYETTTPTYQSGYLDRNQLAITYRLVCSMRGIPKSDYQNGLNGDAKLAIGTAVKHYQEFFELCPNDSVTWSADEPGLPALDELETQLHFIDRVLENYTRPSIKTARKRLQELKTRSARDLTDVYNPAMRYLLTLKREMNSTAAQEDINDLNRLMARHLRSHG